MPDVDLQAIAKSLYARRDTAIFVPYERRETMGWIPSEHGCHDNADRYAHENEGCKSVRGWLLFDFTLGFVVGLPAFYRFTAHSIVEGSDGRLFDITPSRASQRYPFLSHEGPEGEFEAIVDAGYRNLDLALDAS